MKLTEVQFQYSPGSYSYNQGCAEDITIIIKQETGTITVLEDTMNLQVQNSDYLVSMNQVKCEI